MRFREQWIIVEDAAKFFFPPETQWTSLSEVKLKDIAGKSAGNIDLVLVSYDAHGKLLDFGALEVQAVYISGNVSTPFKQFMSDPTAHASFNWAGKRNYPKPDFLSSSRKRLAPQLLFKGGILNHWNKKLAVALDEAFFQTLPTLDEVDASEADVAWLVYDLQHDTQKQKLALTRSRVVYTKFSESLLQITVARPGNMSDFIDILQVKLDRKRNSSPPTNLRLDQIT